MTSTEPEDPDNVPQPEDPDADPRPDDNGYGDEERNG